MAIKDLTRFLFQRNLRQTENKLPFSEALIILFLNFLIFIKTAVQDSEQSSMNVRRRVSSFGIFPAWKLNQLSCRYVSNRSNMV